MEREQPGPRPFDDAVTADRRQGTDEEACGRAGGCDSPVNGFSTDEASEEMAHRARVPEASNARWIEAKEVLVRQLQAARGGSRESIGELLEQCRDYLLAVANQRVRPEMRASIAPSDLVQETFQTAVSKFGQFRGMTETELLVWLSRILRSEFRVAETHDRPAIREGSAFPYRDARSLDDSEWRNFIDAALEAPETTPCRAAIADEESTALFRSMARLPGDLSRVLQLRYWQQCSFVEIGHQMGRSPHAVRRLWVRAVETLCRELGKYSDSNSPEDR